MHVAIEEHAVICAVRDNDTPVISTSLGDSISEACILNEFSGSDGNALQAAIDATASGGTVFVHREVVLNAALKLDGATRITLDFLGNFARLQSGPISNSFIVFTTGLACVLRNVTILAPVGQSAPIIRLTSTPEHVVRFQRLENVRIVGDGASTQFTAVLMEATGNGGPLTRNTFRRMLIENCDVAFQFNVVRYPKTFANMNTFEQIFVNGYRRLVDFGLGTDNAADINQNHFDMIHGQYHFGAEAGFFEVGSSRNVFSHVVTYAGEGAPPANYREWVIHGSASNTLILAHDMTTLCNLGRRTVLISPQITPEAAPDSSQCEMQACVSDTSDCRWE